MAVANLRLVSSSPMREAGLRGRIGGVKRSLYNDDHVAFADSFRRFVAQEITPDYLKWEAEE